MYAKEIAHKKNDAIIQAVCSHAYDPAVFDEEFKDKIGVLGSVVFWTTFSQWPHYDYDDTVGVKEEYLQAHEDKEVIFAPPEMKSFPQGQSCQVFYGIEQHMARNTRPTSLCQRSPVYKTFHSSAGQGKARRDGAVTTPTTLARVPSSCNKRNRRLPNCKPFVFAGLNDCGSSADVRPNSSSTDR